MRAPRGILLDYGGTLVHETAYDPRAGHAALLERASYLPPELTLNDVMARAAIVEQQVSKRRDEVGFEAPWTGIAALIYDSLGVRFHQAFVELEMTYWKASVTTEPIDGASEAVAEFAAANIPVALLSNCSFGAGVLRYELGKHGLASHLRFIMVTADYCVRKPNPLLFSAAATRLGIGKPEDIWFIGDRLDTDVAGAKAAGMQAVHFVNDWPAIQRRFRDSMAHRPM